MGEGGESRGKLTGTAAGIGEGLGDGGEVGRPSVVLGKVLVQGVEPPLTGLVEGVVVAEGVGEPEHAHGADDAALVEADAAEDVVDANGGLVRVEGREGKREPRLLVGPAVVEEREDVPAQLVAAGGDGLAEADVFVGIGDALVQRRAAVEVLGAWLAAEAEDAGVRIGEDAKGLAEAAVQIVDGIQVGWEEKVGVRDLAADELGQEEDLGKVLELVDAVVEGEVVDVEGPGVPEGILLLDEAAAYGGVEVGLVGAAGEDGEGEARGEADGEEAGAGEEERRVADEGAGPETEEGLEEPVAPPHPRQAPPDPPAPLRP